MPDTIAAGGKMAIFPLMPRYCDKGVTLYLSEAPSISSVARNLALFSQKIPSFRAKRGTSYLYTPSITHQNEEPFI